MSENFSCNDSLPGRPDEPLVLMAQQGSERALNLIIRRFTPLVGFRARRLQSSGLEYDDLVQEGLIGLMSAVRSYSRDASALFRTYARVCIDRSMISAIRSQRGVRRIPGNALVSMSDRGEGASGEESDPQSVVIAKDELEDFRFRIFGALSPFERRVLAGFLRGLKYDEIARALGTTVKSVDNALWRIRRKLS